MAQVTVPGARRTVPVGPGLLDELRSALDEPDWLSGLRRHWWARYEDTPFPTGKEEEWRRVSLKGLPSGAEAVMPAADRAPVSPTGSDGRLTGGGGSVLISDGTPLELHLAPHLAEAGVIFTDLASAVRQHPDKVRPYLGTADSLPSHAKFWALAQATWSSGLFLYVPANVEVDAPLFARSELRRSDAAHFPQTLVVAEPNSRATLVEDSVSPDGGEPGWIAGAVDLRVADGARVRYANLQRLGSSAWNVGFQRAEVGANAELTTLNVEIGSKVTKRGIGVEMTGRGGASHLLGVIAAGGDQRIDINSVQDLAASHAVSDLLYLSALYDRAKASFYGLLRVRAGTSQTSSYQECRNLLLSPSAGAEPIPALEILSNDLLRCGHGATAGAIDPTQLFYAQSRGLDADTAQKMIVRGFFEQVLSRIDDESVKQHMLAALAPRIGTESPA